MKQFYSPQKSSSLTFFNLINNGIVASFCRIVLLAFCLLAVPVLSCLAQDAAVSAKEGSGSLVVAGDWLLKEIKIRENGREADSAAYAKCFWIDHKNIPLIISGDGSVEYSKEGKPKIATVKVEDGKLVFYFPMGNVTKVSDTGEVSTSGNSFTSTAYDFNISGNKMTLRKEDPEFLKQFVFKRQ